MYNTSSVNIIILPLIPIWQPCTAARFLQNQQPTKQTSPDNIHRHFRLVWVGVGVGVGVGGGVGVGVGVGYRVGVGLGVGVRVWIGVRVGEIKLTVVNIAEKQSAIAIAFRM